MKRIFMLALVAASAVSLWQLAPAPIVSAGPAVDETIPAPVLAPSSFADVIEAVQPAVVNIAVSGPAPGSRYTPMPPGTPGLPGAPGLEDFEDFLRRFFDRQNYPGDQAAPQFRGMGSGFIIDPDGYVVTNNHVVEHADEIAVTLNDGTRLDAELVGIDPKTDLALLKVETDDPLPYARFGDSDSTRVGDWIIAIGNPFGLGGTATAGIVSARGRDIQSGPFDDFLQIDAPINSGNSGGPLFDLSGRVIGVNTAIFSPNGGNVGIGFAIPSELAESILDQLRATGKVERGWLGVTIQQIDDELAAGLGFEGDGGALVASVVPDSPAAKAGLMPGDVIVSIEGKDVDELKEVTRAVADAKPDETIEIDVWRKGDRETLSVAVGHTPTETANVPRAKTEEPKARLGLSLGELTPQTREQLRLGSDVQGALVTGVVPGSPAATKGLRPGDVIVMVGQSPVKNVAEAIEAINDANTGEGASVLLRVVRGRDALFVAVPFA